MDDELNDELIIVDSEGPVKKANERDVKLVFVGPVAFTRECLETILIAANAYGKPPGEKEACFALLGKITEIEKVPVFLAEKSVMLQGGATPQQATFEVEDLKKIAGEAERNGMILVGLLHTHPRGGAEISTQDKIAWLTLLQETGKNIPFLIYSIGQKELGILYVKQQFIEQLKNIFKVKKAKLEK